MIATAPELLDTSIAQLQTLKAFLGDQLGDNGVESTSSATPELLACREILASLGACSSSFRARIKRGRSGAPFQRP